MHEAISLNPNFGLAHYQLGYAYLVAGEAQKALDQLQLLQELSPRDAMSTGTLTNTFVALFDLKQYDEAIAIGRQAVARPNP